jgi:hypothetical protein
LLAKKRQINMEKAVEPDFQRIWADECALRQVVLNLLLSWHAQMSAVSGPVFESVGNKDLSDHRASAVDCRSKADFEFCVANVEADRCGSAEHEAERVKRRASLDPEWVGED